MNPMLRLVPLGIVLWLAALPAQALQHLMKIREVYVGPADEAQAQYVNLQMYSAFQNFVMGHAVTVFDADDNVVGTYTFPMNLLNGMDQAFILIATPAAETRFGMTADLAMTPDLPAEGGKVCFGAFDCFAWGSYAGDAAAPDATGTPFESETGLAPDTAVRRDISAGDPALLEDSDDTGDSAADFDVAEPSPTTNLALLGGGLPVGAEAVIGTQDAGGAGSLAWLLGAALAALASRRLRRLA